MTTKSKQKTKTKSKSKTSNQRKTKSKSETKTKSKSFSRHKQIGGMEPDYAPQDFILRARANMRKKPVRKPQMSKELLSHLQGLLASKQMTLQEYIKYLVYLKKNQQEEVNQETAYSKSWAQRKVGKVKDKIDAVEYMKILEAAD